MKSKQSKPEFIECARIIRTTVESPSHFLEFLTDAVSSVDHYEKKFPKEDSGTGSTNWFLMMWIREVYQPWVEHKENQEVCIKQMSAGLDEITSLFGAETLQDHVGKILRGVSTEFDDSILTPATLENISKGVTVLLKFAAAAQKLREQQLVPA